MDDGRIEAIVRNVSDRQRADFALRESEERFRRLSEAAFEGIGISDEGKVVDVNSRLAQMLGYEVAEMVGMSVLDLIAPEHRDRAMAHVRSGSPEPYEHLAVRKDGSRFPVEVQGRTIPFQGRNLRVTAVRDVSERYRSEEALRRSEEQYRSVFDGVRDVIFSMSPQGELTSLNAAFEEITGWPRADWLGREFIGLLHPDDAPKALTLLRAVLLDLPRETAELRVRTRRGDLVVGEFRTSVQRKDGQVVAVLGIVRDITGRLQLEGQLRQAQKMEAVGQLAGGVAHDFNNLLSAIIGYSQLLHSDLAPDDRRREDVEEILNAADRATVLTRQLLAFSRRQVLQPKVVSLNKVVAGAEKLLRRLIGEDVALVTRCDPDLGAVLADEGQLEQVIINLAVNARDAMPEGGTLRIETSNVDAETRAPSAELGGMPPGAYVLLTVSDTGIGMDDETRARVFEPFFTTKPEGRGTGLGLSTVFGIAQQSAGFITVASVPKHGTTFSIYLPRVQADVATSEAPATRAATPPGTETILLVEDEAAVRSVTSKLLRRQGYAVLQAPDGLSALRLAATTEAPIALLITDVVMPTLSGPALAEQLTAQRPQLKVLYVSGYADNAVLRHGVLEPGIHFLQKPFNADSLASKVREILDAP
jgi:PAS domain S-box-containing protein